jgi:transcriptional regulator with XRE-family HTH domain
MEEVRRLRLEKGWNQNVLAFHADLAPSVISLVETGRREPNATTLRKLSRALDVEIPDLFGRAEAPKAQAPLSPEDPEQRRSYPYPWMGDTLARMIDGWEQSVEEGEVDGRYAHALAIAAMDALGAALLMGEPGDTMRERAPENEVDERNRVVDRLFRLSGRAIDRYRASDVFESDEEHRMTEQRGRLRLVS